MAVGCLELFGEPEMVKGGCVGWLVRCRDWQWGVMGWRLDRVGGGVMRVAEINGMAGWDLGNCFRAETKGTHNSPACGGLFGMGVAAWNGLGLLVVFLGCWGVLGCWRGPWLLGFVGGVRAEGGSPADGFGGGLNGFGGLRGIGM